MYQDLIRDTEIYQIIMQEGVQQGVQQQQQQEVQDLHRLILYAFRTHFPELAALATERVSAINDLSILNKLALEMIATESVDQARKILDTLNQTEAN